MPQERAQCWGEAVTRYFGHLDAHCEEPEAFEAQMQAYQVGPLRVFSISASGNDVERPPRHLRDHGSDYFKLLLQLEGRSEIMQRDATVTLGHTDWSLYDPAQPYCIHSPRRYKHLVVQIPRPKLQGFAVPNLHTSQIGDVQLQGLFRLLASFLGSLSDQLPTLPGAAGLPLSETIVGLLSSTLAAHQNAYGEHVCLPAVLRARVKQHVQAHLVDPELSLDRIAEQMRCSKRYLHRVFEEEGVTLDRYIWHSRLARCRDALAEAASSGARVSIAEIAFRWGFSSQAHFSRAFKERYGLTPREFLQRGEAGDGQPSSLTTH
nr:helix-turn-helix domain-containing protein [Variovorax terrae]